MVWWLRAQAHNHRPKYSAYTHAHLHQWRIIIVNLRRLPQSSRPLGRPNRSEPLRTFFQSTRIELEETFHICLRVPKFLIRHWYPHRHTNEHIQTKHFNRFIRTFTVFLRCFSLFCFIVLLFFCYNFSIVSTNFKHRKSHFNLVHT